MDFQRDNSSKTRGLIFYSDFLKRGADLLRSEITVMLLVPPSPPNIDISRDWAGGFGTAYARRRNRFGQSADPFFYPFLAYASSVLQDQNFEWSVLDCQKLRLDLPEVMDSVKKRNPNLIVSLIGLPSLKGDLEILNAIKKTLPNTTLACVGTSCQVLQREVFSQSKVDLLLTGKYPYVSNFESFLKVFCAGEDLSNVPSLSYVKHGKVISNCEKYHTDLGSLSPNYDGLDLSGYECFRDMDGNSYQYISVLGSVGCPSCCFYCPYIVGFGSQWSARQPEDLMGELEYLSSRNVKGVMFRDQSFPINEKRALRICDLIVKRKIDMAWLCEARVDQVNRTVLAAMKKAGCKAIQLGVETGDQNLMGIAKPGSSLELIRRAFRLTKEFGLRSMAHIIFGWPDETKQTMQRTGRFVEEIAPERANWSYLTPYPGTRLREIAQVQDLILTNDWTKYTSETVVMRSKWLNANQIRIMGKSIQCHYEKAKTFRLLSSAGKRPRYLFGELQDACRSLIA